MDAGTQRRLEAYATRRGKGGFAFDDIAEAGLAMGASAQDIMDWLAAGRESGEIVALEPDELSDGTVLGPQRFCLASVLEPRHSRGAGGRYPGCDAPPAR